MRDFGLTASKLVDVLANDFAGKDALATAVDVQGYVESLAAAEQAGSLDEGRFDATTREFLAPLSRMCVEYLATPSDGSEGAPRADRPGPCVRLEGDASGTLRIVVGHFKDDGVLSALRENHDAVASASALEIDLRECREGALGNAFCLMSLLFSEPVDLRELMGPQRVRSLYTVRNARYRLEQLARLLPFADRESRAQLEREAAHIQECVSKGWVEEAEYYERLECPAAPEGLPVRVLVGPETAGAAEQLALVLKKAADSGVAHAELVGKPSGKAAFENLLRVPLDDRSWIVYPMTKACGDGPCGKPAL